MRLTRLSGIFMGCMMAFHACAPSRIVPPSVKGLGTLESYMLGDFSSRAQSLRDSAFFDIRLHIRRIWPGRDEKIWLYVEQAAASSEDKPYRQRVYLLDRDGDNGYKSVIYSLTNPSEWVGKYVDPPALESFNTAHLQLRDGCTVWLRHRRDGTFEGNTAGKGCESTLRGAQYATSRVTVTPDRLFSWDQGFDASGKQVWGAVRGGYEFIKQ
jgi:hypothetical protein